MAKIIQFPGLEEKAEENKPELIVKRIYQFCQDVNGCRTGRYIGKVEGYEAFQVSAETKSEMALFPQRTITLTHPHGAEVKFNAGFLVIPYNTEKAERTEQRQTT